MPKRDDDRQQLIRVAVAGLALLASLAMYICLRESLANTMFNVLASR